MFVPTPDLVLFESVNPSRNNEPTKRFKTNDEFVPQDFFENMALKKIVPRRFLF